MAADLSTELQWLQDPDVVVFAGEVELPVGAAEQQGIGDWVRDKFGRSKEEVRQDWEKVMSQMRYLVETVEAPAKDYQLDEVTFQLGFSAEGQVVFVAKAGVTTTISATFRRKPAEVTDATVS
jgi:hypothetical protein